jgi:vancomycin permeability regulator SanA
MVPPDDNAAVTGVAPPRRNLLASAFRFLFVYLFAVALLSALGWCIWVYVQIEHYAYEDQAAQADVICVFGAAEYAGRPSPVLRARLDHALALYEHGIAPVVLTLGGSAPGDAFSEGQVGQAYLEANGVPEKAIIAETQSRPVLTSPRQQVAAVGSASEWQQVWHEIVAYTLWRMHLH